QPDRLSRALVGAAQDHAGSHHDLGVRAVRDLLYEATGQARLPVGRAVPAGRRLLRVSREWGFGVELATARFTFLICAHPCSPSPSPRHSSRSSPPIRPYT